MINSANFTDKDQPYKTVFFETFGCQMNKLDAELSLGLLQEEGYKIVDKVDEAMLSYSTPAAYASMLKIRCILIWEL